MGTPRDYEFYTAARVLLQSLARFEVDADLVVIASKAVPQKWRRTLNDEGVIVKVVNDIPNPYINKPKFDKRFIFTLNKMYAWSLTEYERVVMLDADNLFLRAPDELFQCGEFCAAFINPCIFHTGLFVLKPSNETFKSMLQEIQEKIPNRDGADQGFLTSHYNDLLDRPLFHPPADGSRLTGLYRLPLGYQMDAVYYYLKLKWRVPCGPNSVITFPSVPMLKPWYWWSYPTLPLGIAWHEKRRATIGYGTEIPVLVAESLFYLLTAFTALFMRRRFSVSEKTMGLKSGLPRTPSGDHSLTGRPLILKMVLFGAIIGSYLIPFFIVPTTVHPLMGWGTFLLGSLSLLVVTNSIFQLRLILSVTPWLAGFGMLLVMVWPYHTNGISRSLVMSAYACIASPPIWWAMKGIYFSQDHSLDREPLMAWTTLKAETTPELSKLC